MPLTPRRRSFRSSRGHTAPDAHGYHDALNAFILAERHGDIYAIIHELLHDALFFSCPDGHLSKLAAAWMLSDVPEEKRILARDLSARLTEDSRLAHERFATYAATLVYERVARTPFPLEAFDEEYACHYAYFSEVLDPQLISPWWRYLLSSTAAEWAFSSSRSASVTPGDWLESDVYETIAGPTARLDHWKELATDSAWMRGWIDSAVAAVPQRHRSVLSDVRPNWWWIIEPKAEGYKRRMRRALYHHLRHAIDLPTHPTTWWSFRTTRALIRKGSLEKTIPLRNRLSAIWSDHSIFSNGDAFDVAKSVDRLKVSAGTVKDFIADDYEDLASLLQLEPDAALHLGIAWLGCGAFIVHIHTGWDSENHRWRCHRADLRTMAKLLKTVADRERPPSEVAIIARARRIGGWDDIRRALRAQSWFSDWLSLDKPPEMPEHRLHADLYILIDSDWARVITYYTGLLSTTRYHNEDGTMDHWVDLFRPDDSSIPPLICISPQTAWRVRHPLVARMSELGRLKDEPEAPGDKRGIMSLATSTAISMLIQR